METREWRFLDRSNWPRGMWDDEPDKVQWPDLATGMACLAHRGPTGAWCGYVGVPPGHPLFGVEYSEESPALGGKPVDYAFECHGGLTFSGPCREPEENGRGVCHIAGPGEPDPVWWFGFDCNHCWDATPGGDWHSGDSTYRTLRYVRRNVGDLAGQIAAMGAPAE